MGWLPNQTYPHHDHREGGGVDLLGFRVNSPTPLVWVAIALDDRQVRVSLPDGG